MQTINIGSHNFSKVICGSNPFYGHSHFSDARSAEYKNRFDESTIERTIQTCLDLGVNTIESCANDKIVSILANLRDKNMASIHFIGTTRIDETSPMKSHQQKVAYLIEQRATICVIHAQFVDRPRRGDTINGLQKLVDKIHEANLLAAISTHRVETVELCEQQNIGLDTYMFPLNLSGFVYPGYEGKETVAERITLVQNTPKPMILIKTLAAGRIPPDEGLHFIAEHAKPNDLIDIGIGSPEEAEETIPLIKQYF